MSQDLIAVVGGGVTGASIALHLADRGAPAVLIDAAPPRGERIAPAFGAITALGREPAGHYELACHAIALWPGFARRLGEDVGFRRGGEIRWASEPDGAAALGARVAEAERRGYPIRLLTRGQLWRLLPAARTGPVRLASWAWRDAQVEPDRVVAACHRLLGLAGVRRVLGGQARLGVDDGGARIQVAGELLRPAAVVLAAGAASPRIVAGLGLDLPASGSPGRLVVTSPVAPIGDAVVYPPPGPGPALHLRQRPDGAVVLGEGVEDTVGADTSVRAARELVARAGWYFPALARARPERLLLGWRPMPADRQPVIGPMPGLPWLYVVMVPGAVTAAPAVGRMIADELTGGGPDPLLGLFRPGRFAARALDVMSSVESVFQGQP